MFDSLDETMRQDERKASSTTERLVRYAAMAAASVLLFGGLMYSVHFLS